MAEASMEKVDLIIPVYNEGEVLLQLLTKVENECRASFRILICYDFDEDKTLDVLKKYQGALEIVLVKNKGRGPHNAVISGFEYSTSKCVIVMPADDPYNIDVLDKMVASFKKGNEIVVASRFIEGGCMEGCPWLKAFLCRAASFTLHVFAFIPAEDASNGFRLFSRKLLETVKIESSRGFTYSLELLVKCHRLRWKIGEVPAVWYEREEGQSNFKVLQWLPMYLRWYFYGFATTWLRYKGSSVTRRTKSYFDS